jgi:hypothetical protein
LKESVRVFSSMLVMGMSMSALGFAMYAKHVAWDIPALDTVSIIGKK